MTYSDEVLADTPLIYWRLGETVGTTAADASGNGNTGDYQNTPTLGVTGLQISDSDTAMQVASASLESAKSTGTFSGTYTNHTLEVIVKLTALPTPTPTFGYAHLWGVANNDNLVAIEVENTLGTAIFKYFLDSTPGNLDGPTIVLGTTYHLVGTYNGTTALFYVDGVQVETQANSGAITLLPANFYAGNDDFSEAADGTIDECAFYSHVLSPARIAAHYAAMVSTPPNISDSAYGADAITTDTTRITISPELQIYLKTQMTRTTLATREIQSFAYADAPFARPTHAEAAVVNTSASILYSRFSSDSEYDLFAAESDGTGESQLTRRAEAI